MAAMMTDDLADYATLSGMPNHNEGSAHSSLRGAPNVSVLLTFIP